VAAPDAESLTEATVYFGVGKDIPETIPQSVGSPRPMTEPRFRHAVTNIEAQSAAAQRWTPLAAPPWTSRSPGIDR
jgi:hypothetical protein